MGGRRSSRRSVPLWSKGVEKEAPICGTPVEEARDSTRAGAEEEDADASVEVEEGTDDSVEVEEDSDAGVEEEEVDRDGA